MQLVRYKDASQKAESIGEKSLEIFLFITLIFAFMQILYQVWWIICYKFSTITIITPFKI
jgi:hypothetical protein